MKLLLVLFIFILFFIGRKREVEVWNNGICKETNKPWVIFDMDSSGARLYKSDKEWCTISYSSVDNFY